MTKLWVETYHGEWIRADRITEVGIAEEKEAGAGGYPLPTGKAFVTARMTHSSGSWNEDGGDVGPSEHRLGRYGSDEIASKMAHQLVQVLILKADTGGILRLTSAGLKMEPIGPRKRREGGDTEPPAP